MLPEMTFEEGRETLAPGEIMILYTDGLSESRNAANEEYGADRLAEVCRKNPETSAREMMDAIFRDLEAFTNRAPAADDRTLVIVRRTS
jgi:sigma-B regulation protein RsbU (phosphoserine phosphatase)